MRHLVFLFFFLCVSLPCVHAETSAPLPKILILNSYHRGYAWSDAIVQGMTDALSHDGEKVSIYVEYMDTKHYTSPAYLEKLRSLYAYKYQKVHFDLIMASDDNALDFLIAHKDELFPGTQILFCGANDPKKIHIANDLGMIGIFEDWNAQDTINLALKLFPETRYLAVIADQTTTGKAGQERIRLLEPAYNGTVQFLYITPPNIQKTQQALANLPPDTVILHTVFFVAEDRQWFSSDLLQSSILHSAKAPIFVVSDFSVVPGVIGGFVISGYYQGEAAGKLARTLLSPHESPQKIKQIKTFRPPMFDYTGLQKFGIKLSDLPAGSLILNKPTSFYATYAIWIWLTLVFILFETTLIILFIFNRSHLKKVQKEVIAGKKRLDLVIRGTEQGLFYWDLPTDRIRFKYLWKEILGHSIKPSPTSMEEWLTNIHPDDKKRLEKIRNDHLQGLTPFYELEFRIKTAENIWCWIYGKAKVVEHHKDGSPRQVAGLLHNITDRKKAETEQLRLVSALEQSEEATAITDTKGDILYVNQAFAKFYTINPKTILQTPLREIGHIFQQKKLWNDLKNDITCRKHIVCHAKNSSLGNGTISDLEFKTAVIRDAQGSRMSYIFSLRDISRETTLEEQLRQSQKMEAIGQLAGGIAHDFNNLLQVILGYTSKIIQEGRLDPDTSTCMEHISNASNRAAALIRQLLIFSRRDRGTIELVDLNEVIEDVLSLLKRTLGEQIYLTFNPGAAPSLISADSGQMHQIIMNLCVNARDAMPQGGSIAITTERVYLDQDFVKAHPWAHKGNFVCITIKDSGTGMSPEIQEHMFEPFFTTKETGKGTGIGLATVYGIVKNHAGMIHVRSTENKGTAFYIYLPLTTEAEHRESSLPLPESTEHEPVTATLLVAEDDELVRALTKEVLEDAGYTIITAVDGDEAIRMFHTYHTQLDLIMLDVIMPGKNGQQVWEEVYKLRPDLPVLFSSGYSFNELKDNTLLSDNGQLIQKPYTPGNLLQTLADMLKKPRKS